MYLFRSRWANDNGRSWAIGNGISWATFQCNDTDLRDKLFNLSFFS